MGERNDALPCDRMHGIVPETGWGMREGEQVQGCDSSVLVTSS